MLAQACYKTGDALGEVHALIERAQLGATLPGICVRLFTFLPSGTWLVPASSKSSVPPDQ